MPLSMHKLFLFTMAFSACICFAQETEYRGAHEQQAAEFGLKQKTKSLFDAQGSDIIPLVKRTKSLTHLVFGFLPDWEYTNDAAENLNYDLLSHIAVFSFEASSDGTLTPPAGWPWTDVINAAHSKSTKISMVVTNFNSAQIHTLMTNTTAKNTLFTAIKNTISTYQLDGVNIDFESIDPADRGNLLTNFMADLTNYIHTNLPGKEVSFDSPAVNWAGWKFNDLAAAVDHLLIMAYDYNGSWSTTTAAVSPLVHPTNGISVTKSVEEDYGEAITNYPEKIILGVPYYGKHWTTTSSNPGATITDYEGSTLYRNTAVEVNNHGGYRWDSNSETPYYSWYQTAWNQVWADNPQSLGLKYDLALNKGIGGIGIWALNYDGDRTELWELIETKFTTTLAVEDAFLNKQFKVFPNPSKQTIKITNPTAIPIQSIVLNNSYGQQILELSASAERHNISALAAGLYFLNIRGDDGQRAVIKILKE